MHAMTSRTDEIEQPDEALLQWVAEKNRRLDVAFALYSAELRKDPEKWQILAALLVTDPQIWSAIEKEVARKKRGRRAGKTPAKHSLKFLERLSRDFRAFDAQKKETRKRSGASAPKREARINAFLDAHPDIDTKLKVGPKRISESRFKTLLRFGANADRTVWHAGNWHILPEECYAVYYELRKINSGFFLGPVPDSQLWIVGELLTIDPKKPEDKERLLSLRGIAAFQKLHRLT
jgi:hypothetical protein